MVIPFFFSSIGQSLDSIGSCKYILEAANRTRASALALSVDGVSLYSNNRVALDVTKDNVRGSED